MTQWPSLRRTLRGRGEERQGDRSSGIMTQYGDEHEPSKDLRTGFVIWTGVALATFVGFHGGLRGDVDPYVATIANAEAKNVHAPGLIFNKWKIAYDREHWILKLFLMTNGPAYALALLVFKALRFLPPFDDLFPFGISYPTYPLTLMLVFGLAQWYLVGLMVERWRKCRSGARARPKLA